MTRKASPVEGVFGHEEGNLIVFFACRHRAFDTSYRGYGDGRNLA